jgi:hypothetical protein
LRSPGRYLRTCGRRSGSEKKQKGMRTLNSMRRFHQQSKRRRREWPGGPSKMKKEKRNQTCHCQRNQQYSACRCQQLSLQPTCSRTRRCRDLRHVYKCACRDAIYKRNSSRNTTARIIFVRQ